MTHRRFKKFWTLLRLWLVVRELKRRPKPPLGPLALTLLALGCSYVGAPVKDPVAVLVRDGLPICSAFAIAKNKVLTANHCVADRDEAEVMTQTQWARTATAFTPAVVEYRDTARDIAVLSGEFNFTSNVYLRPPVDGEAVFARSVYFDAITDGNVRAGAGYFRDTDMTIQLGWSGSPVFGLDGKVVGFVHSCEAVTRAHRRECLPFSTQIGVLP